MLAANDRPAEPTPDRTALKTDRAPLASARRTFALEADGLGALAAALDGPLGDAFTQAIELLAGVRGRAVVSGMGKSGHVARKVAATLASTGTPAFFVHPGEASHGDLGMIAAEDVVIALSWSGETVELRDMIHHARRFRVPVVALTSSRESALGRAANVVLVLPKASEACPHGLAPTTSTTMQLVLGDALAVALLERRGFTASDFRNIHPGGRLGAGLRWVRDVMHDGAAVPLVRRGAAMSEAVVVMSAKSFGCAGITDEDGRLIGIITDGDLRRHMSMELLGRPVEAVMTGNPRTIPPDTIASAALEIMNSAKITALFVVEAGRPVGIVHLHDVLRIGVA